MGLEIERKFLVTNTSYRSEAQKKSIRQGFLANDSDRTVRIRIVDNKAKLTIKGKLEGMTRSEFEYEIPLTDGHDLLALCKPPLIVKVRYVLSFGGLSWEVDEFEEENKGLVLAEVEVPSPDFQLQIPDWIGTEVTLDKRYYNANLVKHPYGEWGQ